MNIIEKSDQRVKAYFHDASAHYAATRSPDTEFSVEDTTWSQLSNSLNRFIRRQLYVFLIVVPIAIILGIAYLFVATPSFTADVVMVIDARKVQSFQITPTGETTIDAANTVLTQIEAIKSTRVTWSVIKQLNLIDDPELTRPGRIGALIKFFGHAFGLPSAEDDNSRKQALLTAFNERRTVARVGLTSAIDISFRSQDPERAAQIANTIAEEYIIDQLEGKYEAARRASSWLQDRIDSMRADMTAAETAVVEFKEKHNIIDTGGYNPGFTQGRLINEQQLSEINSQLILANAATAEAKARMDRIHQVMSQDIPDASVADALKSEVIIKLRSQYLELSQRERLLSQKYGENHLVNVNLRSQMQEFKRSISDEMRKIAESYKSDYEIARTREASIQKSLDNLIGNSKGTNQAQVQLRQLEIKSQTAKSMYDNFLHRYNEAVQQQSFPISDARVISPAEPPDRKSWPDPLIVMLASAISGLLLASAIAVIREDSDKVFRSGRQVSDVLHVNCLTMLPKLDQACVDQRNGHRNPDLRQISDSVGLLQYAGQAPFSQFSEALRSVKVAADLRALVDVNKVIGFTSSLPNEGKSTIAANFATMMAQGGSRAILVDCDLRRASLSSKLSPIARAGLTDLICGEEKLDGAIWNDPATGLSFLPAGRSAKTVLHPNDLLGSQKMKALIDALRESFDYVIVDFPPLAAVADTRTTTNFIDSYVYVIEWGVTKVGMVEQDLSKAREVYDRLLGVVLNKVDLAVVGRYEPHAENIYERYAEGALNS